VLAATVLVGATPERTERGRSTTDRPTRHERRDDETETDVEGTLRTGIEYDSNARRRPEGRGVARDGLGRYFLTLEGRLPGTGDGSLRLRLRQGGKVFLQTSEADTLLTEAGVTYRHRLGKHWSAGLDVGLKDRLERRSRQDYNRGRATAGTTLRLDPVYVRARAGWRYFAFRPNPASSSHGPTGSIDAGLDLGKGWRLHGRYGLSRRLFRARRLVRREGLVQRDTERRRRDWLHVVRTGIAYRSGVILEGNYTFWSNVSNAYGQGLTRHGVELATTIPLPWRLYVSAQIQLQRTRYEDPLFLGPNFTVDENDRNSLVASVARTFGEHWEIETRYRLFLEEFGSARPYRRQTGFLGLGYVF
jgi:hypothetical protein